MKIVFDHVNAGYGSTVVLRDLSFQIADGRSISVFGPNGSGKTTLLKVIAGILPYKGSILVEHAGIKQELRHMKRRNLSTIIAMMPQFSEMYFSYTAEQTILLGRYVHSSSRLGIPSTEDKEAVHRILQLVDSEELAKKQINELSGGQKQRILLARAFAQQTPFILLDEPANHLDLKYQFELIKLLNQWRKKETNHIRSTTIGVFHDLNMGIHAADDLMFMKDGKIISYGRKEEILSRRLLQKVFDMDVASEMEREYETWKQLRYESHVATCNID